MIQERARAVRRLREALRRLEAVGQLLGEAKRLAAFDDAFRRDGAWLAGCDEVGRGPLAGPIVAAAVVLPRGTYLPGLRDSKALHPERRLALARLILRRAAAWSVSALPPEAIDTLGIEKANALVLGRAVAGLPLRPDTVLVDGPRVPDARGCFVAVIDGDAKSQVVAASSVLAKVVRDHLMVRLADAFPGYGFERNAGYGTAEHRRALAAMGPTPIHRRTFLKGMSLGKHP